jgi:hypothetical protein
MVETRPGVCPAVRPQPPVEGHDVVKFGLICGFGKRCLVKSLGRALHRVAAADAARVETHHVEPAADIVA